MRFSRERHAHRARVVAGLACHSIDFVEAGQLARRRTGDFDDEKVAGDAASIRDPLERRRGHVVHTRTVRVV